MLWTAVIDWDTIQEIEPIIPQFSAIQAIRHMMMKKWMNGSYITEMKMNIV